MIRPLIVAGLLPLSALAQEAPRVDGQGTADGATIAINELNTDAYPDVRVIATVTQGGAPLTGLTADDFRVREEEVDQASLTVEEELPPLSVVLAIDTSGSMAEAMDATQKAATAFVEGLGDGDAVQILPFAEATEPATAMLTDRAPAVEAIAGLVARGDTALYDAIGASVDLLDGRDGRKAVVVLSDGVDDDGTGAPLSQRTLDEVLARAGEVNLPVFAIGLGTEMDEQVLRRAAEETGGAYLSAPTAADLAAVYDAVGATLSGQYSIRYTSSLPADGTERRVDLEGPDGIQASRTYVAAGEAAPAAEPAEESVAATGTCAPLGAIEGVTPDLQQASQRYDDGLIAITQRDDVRRTAMETLRPVLADPVPYACAIDALGAASALYDAGDIDIVARDEIRDALAAPLGQACAGETGMEAISDCFAVIGDAYDQGLIDIVTRDDLREQAAAPLVAEVTTMADDDAALTQVNELYEAGLIDIVMRDDLRQQILQ